MKYKIIGITNNYGTNIASEELGIVTTRKEAELLKIEYQKKFGKSWKVYICNC